jgi:exosome complex component RRP42
MDISVVTKKRIEELADEGRRLDERKLLEMRPLTIEPGAARMAEGSCRVKIGDTEVMVGVKFGLGTPYTDSPDSGAMMVTAELWPLASERFEFGPPGIQSIELARIIDRGIRESHFIDMKQLCIKEGELVWTVFVDIYPINDDGNLIDACALAAVAALKNAVFPELKDDKIQYGEFTDKKLPLGDAPLTLTLYKIGKKFVLDPTSIEEECAKARITIATTSGKKGEFIHAMQKSGDEALTEKEVLEAIDTITSEIKKLRDKIDLDKK